MAFIALHLNWSCDAVMALKHVERLPLVEDISFTGGLHSFVRVKV